MAKVLRADPQFTQHFVFDIANQKRISTRRRSVLLLIPYDIKQEEIGNRLVQVLEKRHLHVTRPPLNKDDDLVELYRKVQTYEVVVASLMSTEGDDANRWNSQVTLPWVLQ